jgi:hypothetical protein
MLSHPCVWLLVFALRYLVLGCMCIMSVRGLMPSIMGLSGQRIFYQTAPNTLQGRKKKQAWSKIVFYMIQIAAFVTSVSHMFLTAAYAASF